MSLTNSFDVRCTTIAVFPDKGACVVVPKNSHLILVSPGSQDNSYFPEEIVNTSMILQLLDTILPKSTGPQKQHSLPTMTNVKHGGIQNPPSQSTIPRSVQSQCPDIENVRYPDMSLFVLIK
jgi:hypothetical protein